MASAPPEPPSPTITATLGTPSDRRHVGRAGDRLGLAALLGVDAGKGAGGVDQRNDRQAEAVGEFHQPRRLAIAFGARHAEIVTAGGFAVS